MAVGFPAKTNFANGNILPASDLNDITGTLNLLQRKGGMSTGVLASQSATTLQVVPIAYHAIIAPSGHLYTPSAGIWALSVVWDRNLAVNTGDRAFVECAWNTGGLRMSIVPAEEATALVWTGYFAAGTTITTRIYASQAAAIQQDIRAELYLVSV